MNTKIILSAMFAVSLVSPTFAAPILNVIPQGVQAGNWVWEVDIAPDQSLAGILGTPLAFELGFRLTGDPLVNITNLNPLIFDTNNPGNAIFGWEIPYSDANNHPEGIEANCTSCIITNLATFPPGSHAATIVSGSTNEIFSAMGSVNIVTSNPLPLFRITALGPGTGGPLSSTLQWLGAYGGRGRIAQQNGVTSQNFDIYSGSLTQSVPEPAGLTLLGIVATGFAAASKRRRVRR